MNDHTDDAPKSICLEISPQELRYFISCGWALILNLPENSLPTYCGLTKDEIISVSTRLRNIADESGVDM